MSARRWRCATLAVALLASSAGAQQAPRPRLEPARVSGEVVAGAYASIAGFLVGRFALRRVADVVGVENETAMRRIGLAGGVVAGTFATAGVVYGIGNIGNQTGDFDRTVIGSAIGFTAAVGIATVILGPEGRPRTGMSTTRRWATANVIALLPAIGATIAFNSTRRTQ